MNGASESGDGLTRDIDQTGAYIYTRELPPVGARVQMDIMLPTLSGRGAGAHLTGEGLVLRIEPRSEEMPSSPESGFAVSMQFYVESAESVLSHLKRTERLT